MPDAVTREAPAMHQRRANAASAGESGAAIDGHGRLSVRQPHRRRAWKLLGCER
jgi:hypothetical protein